MAYLQHEVVILKSDENWLQEFQKFKPCFHRFVANLYYTRGITSKRVKSVAIHLRGSASTTPKKHRSDGEQLAKLGPI